MSKCISAHTNPGAEYPGFINFTREEDGSVSVTARGDPLQRDGVYVCAWARDKGQPGRCTPGDDHCNNYCNMAPQKGQMQKAPLPCTQVFCGETVKVTLTGGAFAALINESARPSGDPTGVADAVAGEMLDLLDARKLRGSLSNDDMIALINIVRSRYTVVDPHRGG